MQSVKRGSRVAVVLATIAGVTALTAGCSTANSSDPAKTGGVNGKDAVTGANSTTNLIANAVGWPMEPPDCTGTTSVMPVTIYNYSNQTIQFPVQIGQSPDPAYLSAPAQNAGQPTWTEAATHVWVVNGVQGTTCPGQTGEPPFSSMEVIPPGGQLQIAFGMGGIDHSGSSADFQVGAIDYNVQIGSGGAWKSTTASLLPFNVGSAGSNLQMVPINCSSVSAANPTEYESGSVPLNTASCIGIGPYASNSNTQIAPQTPLAPLTSTVPNLATPNCGAADAQGVEVNPLIVTNYTQQAQTVGGNIEGPSAVSPTPSSSTGTIACPNPTFNGTAGVIPNSTIQPLQTEVFWVVSLPGDDASNPVQFSGAPGTGGNTGPQWYQFNPGLRAGSVVSPTITVPAATGGAGTGSTQNGFTITNCNAIAPSSSVSGVNGLPATDGGVAQASAVSTAWLQQTSSLPTPNWSDGATALTLKSANDAICAAFLPASPPQYMTSGVVANSPQQ